MSYHDRIMNLPEPGPFHTGKPVGLLDKAAYMEGNKDARHAAAEIANEADARIHELEAQLAEAKAELHDWIENRGPRLAIEAGTAIVNELSADAWTARRALSLALEQAIAQRDEAHDAMRRAESAELVALAELDEVTAQLAEAERLLESARQECGEWRHRRDLAVIRAEEAEEREGEALKQVATLNVQLSDEYRDWMKEQCNEECRYGERLYAEAKADAARLTGELAEVQHSFHRAKQARETYREEAVRLTRLWQATEAVINDELLAEIRERAEAPEPAEPDWTDARYAQIRRAKGSFAGLIPTTDEIESSEPPRPPHTHYCQEHADMWECSDAACQSGALRECNPAEPHAEEVGE